MYCKWYILLCRSQEGVLFCDLRVGVVFQRLSQYLWYGLGNYKDDPYNTLYLSHSQLSRRFPRLTLAAYFAALASGCMLSRACFPALGKGCMFSCECVYFESSIVCYEAIGFARSYIFLSYSKFYDSRLKPALYIVHLLMTNNCRQSIQYLKHY